MSETTQDQLSSQPEAVPVQQNPSPMVEQRQPLPQPDYVATLTKNAGEQALETNGQSNVNGSLTAGNE